MPAKLRPPADVLAELEETLAVVRVSESQIIGREQHFHGVCDYAAHTVHVDPRPFVIETLLHETLHARYPSWSERRVDKEADRLLSSMSTRTLNRWWRLYQAKKRTRKTPLSMDGD